MPKLSITPRWSMTDTADDKSAGVTAAYPLQRIVDLLVQIQVHGSLAEASRRTGSSYRNAWESLRIGERLFGVPLATMTRGRGALLTPLGDLLVWAEHRVAARLSPLLDSLGAEINVEIERVLEYGHAALRIRASHGFAVQTMRDVLLRERMPVDIRYCSNAKALAALAADDCELAGLHVPIGVYERPVLARLAKWLDPDGQRIVHIANRRLGLRVQKTNPKRIYQLADLARDDVHFVNRQNSSGTRYLLELLLNDENIDPGRINGYDSEEFTHGAVAAFVASGMADAAFGVETPARRFGLHFIPIVTERYFMLGKVATLERPDLRRILDLLRGPAFREAVNDLPGYDATHSGTVATIAETFVEWRDASR